MIKVQPTPRPSEAAKCNSCHDMPGTHELICLPDGMTKETAIRLCPACLWLTLLECHNTLASIIGKAVLLCHSK